MSFSIKSYFRKTEGLVFFLFLFLIPLNLQAERIEPVNSAEEIALSFSYPSAGQHYVNALYDSGKFYLPLDELFSILYIHCIKGKEQSSFQGTWQNENNNRRYDKGEKKVPAQGFRVTDFASYEEGCDTVLRIKQLQNYWTYNSVIVTSSLPDPSLVPEKLEFSFTTDPNRYKLIEVPLYRSGTAEGMAKFEKNGTFAGLGGERLILCRSGDKKEEMIKTFSDGRFFAYQLPPGKYSIKPDSSQIQFLDAESSPEKIEFEVKPTAEGDYIDNLNIELEIKMKTEENASHLSASDSARAEKELKINAEKEIRYDPDHSSDQKLKFQLQAGAFTRFSNAVEMCTRIEELTGVQATVLKYGRIYRVVLTDIPSNEVLISLFRILSINEIEFFQFRKNNEKHPEDV
jgi:hypothetical protein